MSIIKNNEESRSKRGIKGVIFGKSGIGKTSLLWTLPEESTLFIDLEAGDLAVQGWKGDIIKPKTWNHCKNLASWICGPSNKKKTGDYSKEYHELVCRKFGDTSLLNKYDTIFIDSITVAGRLCFDWCSEQPESFTQTGEKDTWGTYGLHAKEMISWISHIHHDNLRNIWFVGILDQKVEKNGTVNFSPQIEGMKTGLELPGIVDQVITMAYTKKNDEMKKRAFYTSALNPYGFPAKDRSGCLDDIESPHLGKLMEKIKNNKPKRDFDYEI